MTHWPGWCVVDEICCQHFRREGWGVFIATFHQKGIAKIPFHHNIPYSLTMCSLFQFLWVNHCKQNLWYFLFVCLVSCFGCRSVICNLHTENIYSVQGMLNTKSNSLGTVSTLLTPFLWSEHGFWEITSKIDNFTHSDFEDLHTVINNALRQDTTKPMARCNCQKCINVKFHNKFKKDNNIDKLLLCWMYVHPVFGSVTWISINSKFKPVIKLIFPCLRIVW